GQRRVSDCSRARAPERVADRHRLAASLSRLDVRVARPSAESPAARSRPEDLDDSSPRRRTFDATHGAAHSGGEASGVAMDPARPSVRSGDRISVCAPPDAGLRCGGGLRPDSVTGMLVTAAGFALDSYSSGGKWVAAANEFVFALVGVAFVVRGPPQARAIAGGARGVLGLGVGLSTVPVLLHGVVLSVLPGTLARLIVVVTISAGAAGTALGLLVFEHVLQQGGEEESL